MSAANSFLTIADVAQLAGISHSTLRAYLAREQMPAASGRLGRTPYWEREAIEPWLADRSRRNTGHEDRLMAIGMSEDELTAYVTRSRAAQGLPPTIEDPATIERMARLLQPTPPPAPVTFPVSDTAMSQIQGSELYGRPHMYDSGQATLDASAALHSARRVRRGRGTSHLVTASPAAAEVIRDYCATVGEGFTMEDEPETRADGRALMKVAQTIAGALPWQREA